LDLKKETPESIGQKFGEFLKVLDYPIENDQALQNNITQGNKKLLHFILYWVITRVSNLQQRAYLAKFLVKLAIPPDLLEDEEMREYNQQYQEMQSEFQATHMHVENIRKDAKDPKDLEKRIAQLDQEKEQLISKIAMFKKKNNSPDFQQLVEATSMLRKAQEEGSKVFEKMNEQRQRLEICEQQLLHTKQKLIDTKKLSGSNITSDKMLELLKLDVKKSRELCDDILGRELMQKRERLQQAELILSEPSMTQSDLERLNNEVKKLQREVIALDEKCKKTKNPQEDKLAIYKSQAALIAKKKDSLIEQARKLEADEKDLDKQISEKEGEFTANKGFKTKGEFKAYSNTIKTKNATFKKMKTIIADIRAEINVLLNTEKLLKTRLEEAETSLKQKEKEKGIEGITEKMSGMEEISEHQENVNKKKQVALEEISQKVTEITATINSKRFELQPVIEGRNKLKEQYQVCILYRLSSIHIMRQSKGMTATYQNLRRKSKICKRGWRD
jgi:intraflagellar transport protein 81